MGWGARRARTIVTKHDAAFHGQALLGQDKQCTNRVRPPPGVRVWVGVDSLHVRIEREVAMTTRYIYETGKISIRTVPTES